VNLTFAEIASIVGAETWKGEERPVSGVSIDTRTLKPGMLFFALQGQTDGHLYVKDAISRGAVGVVVSREWESRQEENISGNILAVDDPLHGLHRLASHIRKTCDIPVVAVTGSNGKTTTKEMIACVLQIRYRVLKNQGNLNNHIGLPLSLCRLNAQAETAVFELGANHFGEIHTLSRLAQPTHGVITNIGKAHIGYFGDLEGVLRAKSEMLDFLSNGRVFLNGDDALLRRVVNRVRLTHTFGFSKLCDLRGEPLPSDERGCPRMKVSGHVFRLNIPGRHHLYNALAALAVGDAFGLSLDEMAVRLNQFSPVEKRSVLMVVNGVKLIDDTYNSNPSSAAASIDTLKELPVSGRRIAVFGDMLELGDCGPKEHRILGMLIVQAGLDSLFGLGPLMRITVNAAREGGMKSAWHYSDPVKLARDLADYVRPGDGLCVKGSRSMHLDEVVNTLKEKESSQPGV